MRTQTFKVCRSTRSGKLYAGYSRETQVFEGLEFDTLEDAEAFIEWVTSKQGWLADLLVSVSMMYYGVYYPVRRHILKWWEDFSNAPTTLSPDYQQPLLRLQPKLF